MADSGIAKLEAMYEQAAKARKPFDIEWVLDAAFFCGKQYTEYNTRQQQFQTIPRDPLRPRAPRPISNKIYHFVMDSYAAAREHAPDVEVLPTNGDSIEISNAKVAQAYIRHLADPTKAAWELRRDRALFWAVLVGEGWNKWTMNEEKGRPDIEFCSPLEIYLGPTQDTYLDARWIIHARTMTPDEIHDTYGVEIPENALDRVDATKTAVLRELGMDTGGPAATVKELWHLPSKRHPEGRMVTWTGGTYLTDAAAPFPYKHGMLPFTQIGHSPIPGTPHFCSGTRTMRPLQMELNQYHGQKTTSRKKFANHKWFLDSTLAESMTMRPDDSDDQVLIGDSRNGQSLPQILQAQMWPDSQDGEWITSEMQDAVGLHDASQGAAPGRVDSASGIEQLQEADKGRLSETRKTMNVAQARGFGMLIELARQYVHAEQIVPDFSASGAPSVHQFKTDSFPKHPILRVVQGDGLPKNRATRRAEVISMWTAGLFGENPRKALELLDYPADMNITGEERDVMEAWNENLLLLRGIAVTPKPWQNHEVHRAVHNECRKTAEFAAAAEKVWGVFEFHLDDTDKAELEEIAVEAERQAMIQAAVEAAVPEPPPVDPNVPAGPPPADSPAPSTGGQPQGQGPQPGAPPA